MPYSAEHASAGPKIKVIVTDEIRRPSGEALTIINAYIFERFGDDPSRWQPIEATKLNAHIDPVTIDFPAASCISVGASHVRDVLQARIRS